MRFYSHGLNAYYSRSTTLNVYIDLSLAVYKIVTSFPSSMVQICQIFEWQIIDICNKEYNRSNSEFQ